MRLRFTLITSGCVLVSSIAGPILWYLWIHVDSANVFSMTITYTEHCPSVSAARCGQFTHVLLLRPQAWTATGWTGKTCFVQTSVTVCVCFWIILFTLAPASNGSVLKCSHCSSTIVLNWTHLNRNYLSLNFQGFHANIVRVVFI